METRLQTVPKSVLVAGWAVHILHRIQHPSQEQDRACVHIHNRVDERAVNPYPHFFRSTGGGHGFETRLQLGDDLAHRLLAVVGPLGHHLLIDSIEI